MLGQQCLKKNIIDQGALHRWQSRSRNRSGESPRKTWTYRLSSLQVAVSAEQYLRRAQADLDDHMYRRRPNKHQADRINILQSRMDQLEGTSLISLCSLTILMSHALSVSELTCVSNGNRKRQRSSEEEEDGRVRPSRSVLGQAFSKDSGLAGYSRNSDDHTNDEGFSHTRLTTG